MINILATTARRPGRWLLALLLAGLGLAGCSGGGYSPPTAATLEVLAQNVQYEGIPGARVTVTVGGTQRQGTTGAQGSVTFTELPAGAANIAIAADTYEPGSFDVDLRKGSQTWELQVLAIDAWQAGIATVRGSEVVDRAADGTSLTFAVEISVVTGENPEPLSTLTSTDFHLSPVDCGWGGPRDCASDAAGNPTGTGGYYATDGVARSFELLPAASRRPYIAGILLERAAWSYASPPWEYLAPALKSFLSALNGDDVVGLASVDSQDGVASLQVLGPFTRDGAGLLDAIDQLSQPPVEPTGYGEGVLFEELMGAIEWVALAAGSEVPGRDATLLVIAESWLSLEHLYEVAAFARASGVRISTAYNSYFGNSELAMRTGGFSTAINDSRQYGMALGSTDSNLSDSAPVYRMQFTVTGERGTFVPGGNVNLHMHINTPSSMANWGAFAYFSVAIPE